MERKEEKAMAALTMKVGVRGENSSLKTSRSLRPTQRRFVQLLYTNK